MPAIKAILKQRLRRAKSIAILGIGSELRGDDAAGVLVAKELKTKLKKFKAQKCFKIFIGDTAPENLSGEIKKFAPTHLVIVDVLDYPGKPGEAVVMGIEQIRGISFSTHRLPIKILADYLSQSVGCQVIMLGIKPAKLEFNQPPSEDVLKSVKHLSGVLEDILGVMPFRKK